LELVNWGVLVVLLVAGAVQVAKPEIYDGIQLGWEPNVGKMPEAAARYIEENNLPGPIFHHQAWGGYLLYRWYPQRKVFIDGRVDMYGPEIANDYIEAMAVRPGWRDVLERHRVQTVLLGAKSALASVLLASGQWQRVFESELEQIVVRVASDDAAGGASGRRKEATLKNRRGADD
jgi:hypothetical protein